MLCYMCALYRILLFTSLHLFLLSCSDHFSALSLVGPFTIEVIHGLSKVKAGISVFSLIGWHDLQQSVLRMKLHSNGNSLLNTWYTDEGI